MTILERMKKIEEMARFLEQEVRDLHAEIQSAIVNPEWLIKSSLQNNDSENISTEDISKRQGEE